MATFNLSELKDQGPVGPIPAGEYVVQITNVTTGEFGETSASFAAGFEKIDIDFKVIEGDFEGRKIKHFGLSGSPVTVNGKQNFMLGNLLKALGFDGDEVAIPEGDEWDDYIEEVIGLRLKVDPTNDKGQTFNSVAAFIPVDDVKNTPTAATEVVIPKAGGRPQRSGGAAKPASGGRARPARGGSLNF